VATFRYTKTHEYIREDGGSYFLGITDHAQHELGDITFVELPDAGATFKAGESCCTVESVKAVAEVYAPVGMKVVAGNDSLDENPEQINKDAAGAGWLIQFEPTDLAELEKLMDQAAYNELAK
jgi:glycine cleavage system H protein